jgi:pimeloyl-ACP methyl ester carboxylesterase
LSTLFRLTAQTTLAGRFLNRSGMALTYEVRGAGPILVCHPGGPGFSARRFEGLAGIDGSRTLVLFNPRGTAGSDRPGDARDYELDDYVNDLEDLRLHLGLETIHLVGHSHGGTVAIDYAARYPRQVSKLVLVTTLARFAGVQKDAMDKSMAARSSEPWYADAMAAVEREQAGDFVTDADLGALWDREVPFYFANFGEAEQAYCERQRGEPLNADTLRHFNREIFETFDLRPELSRIKAPTLVVVGEHDFITGPVCGAELVDGIPKAELVTLPAGHMVFVEAPDAFREALLEFLARP